MHNYVARFEALLHKVPRYEAEWALQKFIASLPRQIKNLTLISVVDTLSAAIKKVETIELANRVAERRGSLQTNRGGQVRGKRRGSDGFSFSRG